jgi:hypothetical protein
VVLVSFDAGAHTPVTAVENPASKQVEVLLYFMSRTFPKKNEKFRCHFFLDLFLVLSHFRVFLSDGSSKTLQKRFTESSVQKFLQKNRQKIQNSPSPGLPPSSIFYCVFRAFFVRGGQKKTQKEQQQKQNLTLVLFWPLKFYLPWQGARGSPVPFSFCGPLSLVAFKSF